MDKTLAANLDILKDAVGKNWDGIMMVDGIEGVAKTTLAGDIAKYLDDSYNLNHVVFSPDQFYDAVELTLPHGVIHWDEFVFGGLSTEHATRAQNALIKMFTTIRKKQLYIILVMPYFFMVRPYFAIMRSRCLVHCYTPDGIARGFFSFYSYKRKMELYQRAHRARNWQYSVNPNFKGRFSDSFGRYWDKDQYDAKKEAAIKSIPRMGDPGKDTRGQGVLRRFGL